MSGIFPSHAPRGCGFDSRFCHISTAGFDNMYVYIVYTYDDLFTPERQFPTLGRRGHSPKWHTAAGTAACTTTDTGNTVPQRANPTQTAYAHPNRGQGRGLRLGTWMLVCPQKEPIHV